MRLLYFCSSIRDVGGAQGRGPSRASRLIKDIVLVTSVLAVATGLAYVVNPSQPTAQSGNEFSLDVRPFLGPVPGGGTATTTVTATAASASPRNILFSCVDLPPGTACSFAPTSCRPTCSAQLILVTSTDAPAGTHVVTVAGSDGTMSRTTTFSVTLSVPASPARFDFSLGVNPQSGSVLTGGAVSTNVTASSTSGLTHAVQFSCSNLPPETTCTFAPPSCNLACTSGLTFATSAHTPPGTYAIQVTASDGNLSRTSGYSLVVSPSNISIFTFQKGDGWGAFSETDDATIDNGTPDVNYGANSTFSADGETCLANGTVCRSLLSFPNFIGPNEGQVPEGSTILSAILELNVTNSGPDQQVYQVLEAWTEATVTWNSFFVPGMPRARGPTSMFNTTLGWNAVNITGIVQNWVDGDANLGIFLRCDFWNGSYYSSSESTNPPKLTVTFWAPPQAVRQAVDSRAGISGPSRSGDVPSLPPPVMSSDEVSGLARLEMRLRSASPRLDLSANGKDAD